MAGWHENSEKRGCQRPPGVARHQCNSSSQYMQSQSVVDAAPNIWSYNGSDRLL